MLRRAMTELQWRPADLLSLTPSQLACLGVDDEAPKMESADDFLVEAEERTRLRAIEDAKWTT